MWRDEGQFRHRTMSAEIGDPAISIVHEPAD
jgi:hypothetical protein